VIVDPSHGTGRRDLIAPMCRASVFAGADGLMIEVHPDPEHALCDGPQSLDIPAFEALSASLTPLVEFEGKKR
jgi:3-deoxy-7-phosphoheptulonate synthase